MIGTEAETGTGIGTDTVAGTGIVHSEKETIYRYRGRKSIRDKDRDRNS